jgi:hypothetical protein
MLVIAGPGSGKTFSLVLRTLNLLLPKKAEPRDLVICTFTENAAFVPVRWLFPINGRSGLRASARKIEARQSEFAAGVGSLIPLR